MKRGVQRGDIIVMISDTAVKTIGDMTGAIEAIKETGRASAVVLFQRGSDSRYVRAVFGIVFVGFYAGFYTGFYVFWLW